MLNLRAEPLALAAAAAVAGQCSSAACCSCQAARGRSLSRRYAREVTSRLRQRPCRAAALPLPTLELPLGASGLAGRRSLAGAATEKPMGCCTVAPVAAAAAAAAASCASALAAAWTSSCACACSCSIASSAGEPKLLQPGRRLRGVSLSPQSLSAATGALHRGPHCAVSTTVSTLQVAAEQEAGGQGGVLVGTGAGRCSIAGCKAR